MSVSFITLWKAGKRNGKYGSNNTESLWTSIYEWTALPWWDYDQWITCWFTMRTRSIVCTRIMDFATVSDSLCDTLTPPPTTETSDVGTSSCWWWSWWSYSTCSVACGWWMQTKTRICEIPWHCTNDPDGTTSTQSCNTNPCPIDGVCNNSVQYSCSVGTSEANVAWLCEQNSTWNWFKLRKYSKL